MTEAGPLDLISDEEEEEGRDIRLPGVRRGTCVCACVHVHVCSVSPRVQSKQRGGKDWKDNHIKWPTAFQWPHQRKLGHNRGGIPPYFDYDYCTTPHEILPCCDRSVRSLCTVLLPWSITVYRSLTLLWSITVYRSLTLPWSITVYRSLTLIDHCVPFSYLTLIDHCVPFSYLAVIDHCVPFSYLDRALYRYLTLLWSITVPLSYLAVIDHCVPFSYRWYELSEDKAWD